MQLIEIHDGLENMRAYYDAVGEFGSLGYGLMRLTPPPIAMLLDLRGYFPFLCFVSSLVDLGAIGGMVTWTRWTLYSEDIPLDFVEFTTHYTHYHERFPGGVDLPNLCWSDYLGFNNLKKQEGPYAAYRGT